jgi:hypothetical protein
MAVLLYDVILNHKLINRKENKMKPNVKKLGIVLYTLSAVLLGCKKDDLTPVTGSYNTSKDVNGVVKDGGMVPDQKGNPLVDGSNVPSGKDDAQGKEAWKINAINLQNISGDYGIDVQEKFVGWKFMFMDDGTVVATKNNAVVKGKFSKDLKGYLVLDFGDQLSFNQLNKPWKIMKESQNIKQLENLSKSGLTDYLVFEK